MNYMICCNLPGCLPESDPWVFQTDDKRAPIPQVLALLRAEIENRCDHYGDETDPAWSAILNEADNNEERAAEFDEAGIRYDLPDGYVLTAELLSDEELIGLGWTKNEEGDWE